MAASLLELPAMFLGPFWAWVDATPIYVLMVLFVALVLFALLAVSLLLPRVRAGWSSSPTDQTASSSSSSSTSSRPSPAPSYPPKRRTSPAILRPDEPNPSRSHVGTTAGWPSATSASSAPSPARPTLRLTPDLSSLPSCVSASYSPPTTKRTALSQRSRRLSPT